MTDFNIRASITADPAALRQGLREAASAVSSFSQEVATASKAATDASERVVTSEVAKAKAAADSAAAQERSSETVTRVRRAEAIAAERAAEASQQASRRSAIAAERHSATYQNIGSSAQRAYREASDAAKQSADIQEAGSRRMLASLSRVAGFAGLAMLGKSIFDAGTGFHQFTENAEIAFGVLLGGEEQARSFLSAILELARQTPYAYTLLAEEAQKLLASGFGQGEIEAILLATGDAATAMGQGAEGVVRLNRAFAQIEGKGRLQSQELLQMSEMGVNGLKILANQAGMTTTEYQELITKGLIPSGEAVAGLVQGINEGTNGINGITPAMGGLMAQIKGSGGLTATLDSAKSGFRNMSAALTDSLMPTYISLIELGTGLMRGIKGVADTFNALPAPIRNASLAAAAMVLSMRLLRGLVNTTALAAGARAGWAAYQHNLTLVRTQADAAGLSLNRLQLSMRAAAMGTGMLRGAGAGLLGMLGGPVGIALTAAAAGVVAYSSAQADAAGRVENLSQGISAQTGLLEDSAAAAQEVVDSLSTDVNTGAFAWIQTGGSGWSMIDWADEFGVSLDLLTEAWKGNAEAAAEVDRIVRAADSAGGFSRETERQYEGLRELRKRTAELSEARGLATRRERAAAAAAEDTTAEVDDQTRSLAGSSAAWREWGEEQLKSIEKAREAGRSSVDLNVGRLDLNLSSEEDLAAARERVASENIRLRDSEWRLDELRKREGVTSRELTQMEEDVEAARRSATKATEDLAGVEDRRDPVAQYRKVTSDMVAAAEQFRADIESLAESGLNAQDLMSIIEAGPEGSADIREAFRLEPELVLEANSTRDLMDSLSEEIATISGTTQSYIEAGGDAIGIPLGVAISAALTDSVPQTLTDFAAQLGTDATTLETVGNTLGMSFMNGFSSVIASANPLNTFLYGSSGLPTVPGHGAWQVPGSSWSGGMGGGTPTLSFASGGILPGYSPGRDIYSFQGALGTLNLSGGEAIMRPEFARAMGAGWINRMNQLASSGGVGALRREFAASRQYNFAGGGIFSPQVVTVPVESRHSYQDGNIYINTLNARDLADFKQQTRQMRGLNNFVGRR